MNNDRNVGICRRHFGAVLICGASAVLAGTIALPLAAADKESKGDESKGNIAKTYEDCVTRGIDYLRVKGQAADGSFSSRAGIGPTALATTAMLSHGRKASDPTVAKALAYLEKNVREDGGIYSSGSWFQNYETCVASWLHRGQRRRRLRQDLAGADKFLKRTSSGPTAKTNPAT